MSLDLNRQVVHFHPQPPDNRQAGIPEFERTKGVSLVLLVPSPSSVTQLINLVLIVKAQRLLAVATDYRSWY